MKSILIKSQQIELNPTKRKKKLKQQNFVISLLLQRLPHIVNTIKFYFKWLCVLRDRPFTFKGGRAYCNSLPSFHGHETSVIFLKILPKISCSKLQGQINYFVHLSGHLTSFSKIWQQKKYSTPAPPKEKINKWGYLLDNIILA